MKKEKEMNRIKRINVLMLIAIMALSLLAGCGSSGGSSDAEPAATTSVTENEYGYVDESIDTSNGITDEMTGRLADIKTAGKLTVATEPYFAPEEFIDPNKSGQEQYVGADMDLAKRIAERMGVELEIVPLEFGAVLSSVAEGKYDLAISALAYTPERSKSMELSKGFHFEDEEYGLMVRAEDDGNIKTADDLADRIVITQSGSLQEALVNDNISAYKEFKLVSSMNDAFLAVQSGKADAAMVAIPNAKLYIENNPDCGMVISDAVKVTLDEVYGGLRIGAQKGELDLIAFVNGCIDEVVDSGEYEKWFDDYSVYAGELGL